MTTMATAVDGAGTGDPSPGSMEEVEKVGVVEEAGASPSYDANADIQTQIQKKVEGQPYMGLSYVLTVVQFMLITLDLFMDTSLTQAWHYTITTIEFLTALSLSLYQFVRIVYVYEYLNKKKKNKRSASASSSSSCCCYGQNDNDNTSSANTSANTVLSMLWISFLVQLSIVGCAGYSFVDNNDGVEWALFATSIVWGIVHPSTFGAVQQLYDDDEDLNDDSENDNDNDNGNNDGDKEEEDSGRKQKKQKQKQRRMGPVEAFMSVFRYHFSRAPWLSLLGFLFASGNAVLTTLQGAVINELTKAVTSTPTLEDDHDDLAVLVREQCQILILIWAGANVCKFLFDVVSAQLFSKLEVWLRRSVFDRACAAATSSSSSSSTTGDSGGGTTSLPDIASYQTNYGSDIAGVVGLYNSLLTGLIVNVLMICTAFVYLAVENWKIALVTLSFLGMGVTSGPTNLAGDNSVETQHHIKDGIALLGSLSSTSSSSPPPPPSSSASPAVTTTAKTQTMEKNGQSTSLDKTVNDNIDLPKRLSRRNEDVTSLRQEHEDEVLKPIQKSLFKRTFYTNSVETFIGFYSSFLTVIVVITMSWDVFDGEMEPQDFLGKFFVFKQLQSPAKKMSGILKKLVKSTSHLQRINDVVLGDGNVGGGKVNGTTEAAKQETSLSSPTAAAEL